MASISGKTDPVVRRISATDVTDALGKGLRDFQAMPIYGMLLGAMFAGGGSMAVLTTTAFGMSYLSYPLAAGFVLIGPFAAIFLYELSRRREEGRPIQLVDIGKTVIGRSEIGWMAFVTIFIFVIWIYQVRLWMVLLLGLHASFASLQQFIAADDQ